MKRNNKAFTLIELVVSITIFSIIISTAFAQFPYLMVNIKKVWNEKFIINESIKLKEEFLISNKSLSFYTYKSLVDLNDTQYDFENKYRKNLRDVIENVIRDEYWLHSYSLNNPWNCKLPYDTNQYISDLDKSIIEDEFDLGKCIDDINDNLFDDNYKILTIVDRENLVVNIYFVYASQLHKITTSLITDLVNDDIIYNNLSTSKISLKIYKWFELNKFSWNSYNFCSLDNLPWEECVFTDYMKQQKQPWVLNITMYKLTKYWNDINIKSSFILKTIYSLNY